MIEPVRIFNVLSFIGVVTAVGLWWTGHHTSMFVAATLGAVCWFLGVRVRMRRISDEAHRERAAAEAEENDE